jgi:transcriptional regulator with XRE-family HTH domain
VRAGGEFGAFLRTRRSRIRPEESGAHRRPRRVPGLRREEVADIAGLSLDYYSRLEQGRAANPSADVLDAVARALRLDEAERAHLFTLAGTALPGHRRRHAPALVNPGLARALRTLEHTPALILARNMDVLAANPLARALLTDFPALPYRDRNLARYVFLDPAARSLYLDWPVVAEDIATALRMDLGDGPDDPRSADLLRDLLDDADFARIWRSHDVRRLNRGVKRYRHPEVGDLTLHYDRLTTPDEPDQRMSLYTAEPGSVSEQRLARLARAAGGVPAVGVG